MTNKELLEGIEYIKNKMVAVSTGGPRIDDVNDQYQRTYAAVVAELARRGIDLSLIHI